MWNFGQKKHWQCVSEEFNYSFEHNKPCVLVGLYMSWLSTLHGLFQYTEPHVPEYMALWLLNPMLHGSLFEYWAPCTCIHGLFEAVSQSSGSDEEFDTNACSWRARRHSASDLPELLKKTLFHPNESKQRSTRSAHKKIWIKRVSILNVSTKFLQHPPYKRLV